MKKNCLQMLWEEWKFTNQHSIIILLCIFDAHIFFTNNSPGLWSNTSVISSPIFLQEVISQVRWWSLHGASVREISSVRDEPVAPFLQQSLFWCKISSLLPLQSNLQLLLPVYPEIIVSCYGPRRVSRRWNVSGVDSASYGAKEATWVIGFVNYR